jgi:hypothetical protein
LTLTLGPQQDPLPLFLGRPKHRGDLDAESRADLVADRAVLRPGLLELRLNGGKLSLQVLGLAGPLA